MKSEEQEIAEQLEKVLRRAAIFSEGVKSQFWEELVSLFDELEKKAFAKWTDANVSDTAVVIELQQIGKLGRVLKRHVQAAIDDAIQYTQ